VGSSVVLQQMRSIAKYIWIFLFIAFVGGFLLGDVSGLIGRAPVTASSVVATVNGEEIPYLTWQNLVNSLAQQEQQQSQRGITLDDQRRLEEQAFEQLVGDVLLSQEYARRGIRVSDAEIREAALLSPPPQVYQNPDFQTDGRFDPAKYQRFISSPVARQQGLLVQLENYYRAELPKSKLYAQLIADAWVSDGQLWRAYQDQRDSVTIQYVALRPAAAEVAATVVADKDIRAYYDRYETRWTRRGRAVISFVALSRVPTAADTAATQARAAALRAEILAGADFGEVAKRESADESSAGTGGELPKGGRGRFVPEFETAAYQLRPGQVSEPVRTAFGWHLIKLNARVGDTLSMQHILLKVTQGDSSASATDRTADRLASLAGGSTDRTALDSAAAALKLLVTQIEVQDGQAANYLGQPLPGISGWAFSGVAAGETSDLLDDENGYYLARLDSLTEGGPQAFDDVKNEIKTVLQGRAASAALKTKAEALLADAKSSDLAAAAAKAGLTVESAGPFVRQGFVAGLGFANPAIGAAFAAPIGRPTLAMSDEGAFIIVPTARTSANREVFETEKTILREQALQGIRQRRVQEFFEQLRRSAEIDDRRREINAGLRRQAAIAN
jgi:peptidyl-prolyl cis-trans isomerase D